MLTPDASLLARFLLLSAAAPVKKRNKHVPTHLQAQWDADRARKAEFKLARAEARLADQLDPYSSSSKKSRNKDKKARGKHQKGQKLSALDFDDDESDEEGEEGSDGGWGVKKRKSERKGGVADLRNLDAEIQVFLKDGGKTTMSLPPMDKASRRKVSFFLLSMSACLPIEAIGC